MTGTRALLLVTGDDEGTTVLSGLVRQLGYAAANGPAHELAADRAGEWLAGQFSGADRVLVTDPDLPASLDTYLAAAATLDARVAVVVVLRHPAEQRPDRADPVTAEARTTTWLDRQLGTEHRTRQLPRAMVRYKDLVHDWQSTLTRVQEATGAPLLSAATMDQLARAERLVAVVPEPGTADWRPLGLPRDLQDLAARSYAALRSIAEGGGDLSFVDSLRAEYAALRRDVHPDGSRR